MASKTYNLLKRNNGALAFALAIITLIVGGLSSTSSASTPITIDANVNTHQASNGTSITSPSFSTTQPNELVVAYVSTDGSSAGKQTFSSVSGGGLIWTLRQRSNAQPGDAEIWQAVAPSPLSGASVTATRSSGSYQGSIQVVSYTGANITTNGTTGSQGAASGAATVSLTTTSANSWIWGVGNDWDKSTARTIGTGQTLADQYLDKTTGDTFWTQYANNQGQAAGTKVTLNDTAPTADHWNMASIEITPAQAGAPDTTPPSVPANLTATATSGTQANLSWTASTDNVGVTGYNVYRNGALISTSNGTTYSDTTLSPNTTYTYSVNAFDAAGNSSAQTAGVNVTTPNTFLPPSVSLTAKPAAQTNNPTASFSFTASNPSDPAGTLAYQCSINGAAYASCTSPQVYNGLPDGTQSFSVEAIDTSDGLTSTAANYSWLIDTAAPSVSLSNPTSNTTVSGTIAVSANAADENSIKSVQFQLDGANLGTADQAAPYSLSWDTTTVANGSHTLSAIATDEAGNTTVAATVPITVNNVAPTSSSIWPSTATPGTLTDSDPSAIELGLKFQSSVATNVTGVRFYKSPTNTGTHTGSLWSSTGSRLATVTFTNETASGWQQANFSSSVAIAANTTYVISYHTNVGHYSSDNNYFATQGVTSGTLQALSNTAGGGNGVYTYGSTSSFPNQSYKASNYWVDVVTSATGSGTPDTTPPSVPANLTATAASTTQANLSWNASTDNVGVAGYNIYRNGALIGTTAGTSFGDATLSPNTTYTYSVSAFDAAGNSSAQTTGVNVTTPPSGTGGNTIFSDDFPGTSLSSAWTVISRHGEYGQNETECNTPQQVGVANNTLTISTIAQQTSCGDFNVDGSVQTPASNWPYATGDIQWKSFNFTYGTVSYRAKFPPKSTSTWPAIWLLGSNCQNTNPYTAATDYNTCPGTSDSRYVEIDATECFANNWCQLALSQKSSFPSCDYPVDDNWHNFSLVWTPTSISMSVDGQPTGCSFTSAKGYTIPSTPMFLIIQTQTGGVAGTPANLPTNFQVSNVTVTQP